MSQFQNYPQMDNVPPTQSSTIGYPQTPGYQPGMGFPGTQQQFQGYPQGYPQVPGYQATPGFTAQPGYQPTPGTPAVPQIPFIEQSYIENILRLNRGKIATVYMSFENSQWGSKIFKGVIEAAGKDHLILSDPATGMRYLLLTIYLNYITFDEEIAYDYPFAFGSPALGTAAPLYNVPGQTTAPFTQTRKKETQNINNNNNK